MTELLGDCDHFIAGAALIGGISYFHAYAYDLLATNERIMAATCDAAIEAHRQGRLQKVTYLSAPRWCSSRPSTGRRKEGDERTIPPPLSSYGFQKLAVEYFAKAAWDQYRLPYTIVRPFNCVGIGEGRALGDVEVLERQRQAGDEPRGARPGPEDRSRARTRCTSSATGTRCGTTPTAATWPGASSTAMESRRRPPTRTSTSPPPSRPPCWSSPR